MHGRRGAKKGKGEIGEGKARERGVRHG